MRTIIRNRKIASICRHKMTILLCICLGGIYATTAQHSAAASPNLIWYPYLQQLTNTSVTIVWSTHSGTNPVVSYTTAASTPTVIQGSSRPLAALGTQLHRVTLIDLQPSSTYYYSIFVDNEELLSGETLSFRTAPDTRDASAFTFLAFGDYGITTASQARLRDQMRRDSFNFILTTGDNAYLDASYADFDRAVFRIYGDLFARAPVFPSLGNREYRTARAAPYLDLFELSAMTWRPDDQERYYSFDYGSAHIVVLDSNAPLDVDDSAANDDMLDWLRADLAQTEQPWKIAAFHHPAYSTGSHGSDLRVQAKLIPIFEAYGVQLVLNGHDHNYQRSLPLRAGQVASTAEGGVVYVVTGAGESASSPCTMASWLAFARCSQPYGLYSRITIDGDSMTIQAVNNTGAVEDAVTLDRLQPPPAPTPTPTIPPIETKTYAADTFSRNITDSWGSAEIGGSYALTGSTADFDVTGAAGTIGFAAANRSRSAYLPDVSAHDIDITLRFQTDKPAVGGGQMAYAIARWNNGHAYLGRVRLATDGSVRLQAIQESNGVATLLGGEKVVPGITYAGGQMIRLRVQVSGVDPTSIRMKAWIDGQDEPSAWQYTVTDATAGLQTAGAVGLRAYLSSTASNMPVVFTFDDLRITDL
jgi:hypothetical protein